MRVCVAECVSLWGIFYGFASITSSVSAELTPVIVWTNNEEGEGGRERGREGGEREGGRGREGEEEMNLCNTCRLVPSFRAAAQ